MITAFLEPPLPPVILSRFPRFRLPPILPGSRPPVAPLPRLDTKQSKIWNHEAPGNYERCILSIYLLQTDFFNWLSNIK